MSRPQILIVDDDADIQRLLEAFLRRNGYDVVQAADGRSGLDAAATSAADVVLLDLGLPDMSGMEVLGSLRAQADTAAIVVITGQPTYETAVRALKEGADNFVTKPLDLELLLAVVRKAEEAARLRRRLLGPSEPESSADRLRACPSAAMRRLVEALAAVAGSDGNVLISGETGSGKSLVARAIHDLSRRAAGPFVELNCASLARELLESELFGHAVGAFTGAVRAKPGLFEVADRGTLLLDEIGDMDLAVQPKLLKAIEDRRIRRLGSVQAHDVDVRVLAASHFALSRLVDEGRFRSDLFFRLDVLRLHVPPLRERREDIPHLAAQLLRRVRRPGAGPARGFTEEALAWLAQQPWPGNVRELQNVVERAAVHAGDAPITAAHLAGGGLPLTTVPPDARPVVLEMSSVDEPGAGSGDCTLATAERRHVTAVLTALGGNKSAAARRLGITRQTLLRKLRTWNGAPGGDGGEIEPPRAGGGGGRERIRTGREE